MYKDETGYEKKEVKNAEYGKERLKRWRLLRPGNYQFRQFLIIFIFSFK